MTILRAIHAEFIKMRHTALPWIHIIIPFLGALVFIVYFALYAHVEPMKKCIFVLEVTAIVFPILIGTICGVSAMNEERAGGFQTMLGSQSPRSVAYLAKVITLVLLSSISLTLLVGLFLGGASLLTAAKEIPVGLVIELSASIFAGNVIVYILCLFLSMKWGLGASAFAGIVGSLLVVLFSNFDAVLIGYYIPFTWGMSFFKGLLAAYSTHSSVLEVFFPNVQVTTYIVLFFCLAIGLSLFWFNRWEGRKSSE